MSLENLITDLSKKVAKLKKENTEQANEIESLKLAIKHYEDRNVQLFNENIKLNKALDIYVEEDIKVEKPVELNGEAFKELTLEEENEELKIRINRVLELSGVPWINKTLKGE